MGVGNGLLRINTHRVGKAFHEYRDSRQALRRAGPFLHQVEIFPDNGRLGIRLASVRKALAMLSELAGA